MVRSYERLEPNIDFVPSRHHYMSDSDKQHLAQSWRDAKHASCRLSLTCQVKVSCPLIQIESMMASLLLGDQLQFEPSACFAAAMGHSQGVVPAVGAAGMRTVVAAPPWEGLRG